MESELISRLQSFLFFDMAYQTHQSSTHINHATLETTPRTRNRKNDSAFYVGPLTKFDFLIHQTSNQMDNLSLGSSSSVSPKNKNRSTSRKNSNTISPDTYLEQSETQLAMNEFADDEQTNDSSNKMVSLTHSPTAQTTATTTKSKNNNKMEKDFESRLVKPATKKTWISPYQTRNENLYFFLFRYKVYACPYRRNCPEKVVCQMYHHEGEKRRHPGSGPTFLYSEEACQQVKPFGSVKWLPQSRCANGDRCQFAHTILEQMYHPNIYKTSMCMNYSNPCGNRCKWGYYCTHAHGEDDIRPPISRRASHTRTPLTFETTTSLSDQLMPVACAPVDKQGHVQNIVLDENAVGVDKHELLQDYGWIMAGNNHVPEKTVISPKREQGNHGKEEIKVMNPEMSGIMTGCFADPNIFWMNSAGTNGGDVFKAVAHTNELTTMDEENNKAMNMYFRTDNEPEFLKELSPPAAQGCGLFDSDSEYDYNDNEYLMESFPINISLPFQWEGNDDDCGDTETMEWKDGETIDTCSDDKSSSLIAVKRRTCESCRNVPQDVMQLLTPCGHVVCQSCYSNEMKCFLCNRDVFRALAYDCHQP